MTDQRFRKDTAVRCLFLYPRPEVGGGVVEYVETLRKYLPAEFHSEHYPIGSRLLQESYIRQIARTVKDALGLLRHLRKIPYDIVHLNPSFTLKSILRDGLFLWMCRFGSVGVVSIQFHGWRHNLSERIARSYLLRKLFLITYAHADELVVLSDAGRTALMTLGVDEGKIHIGYGIFDSDAFRPVRTKNYRQIRILFLSRFIPEKGIHNLFVAFAALASKYDDVELCLAGDGPEMPWVVNMLETSGLQGRVTLTGYVKGAQKSDVLWAANVFILPSETEGCPISMLEAMATGSAVVVSRVGCIPEIIRHGGNGLILEDNGATSIEFALRRLLDNPDWVKTMGKRNQLESWAKYSAEVAGPGIAQRLMKLLELKSSNA